MMLPESQARDHDMVSQMEQSFHMNKPNQEVPYLEKFRLFETHSNFYMIGQDKFGAVQRVLKINRSEPCELNITEDSTEYSELECCELLRRIDEGNKSTGGLKFVTVSYGIVGFVKFLGPYYMLLITKRRKIGVICGHAIYAIAKSKMISIPNSTVQSNVAYSKNENRYKKLLCTVDLTKDFYFSYSYNLMCSLQKNMETHAAGHVLYETMFVWNEFMTRGIRSHLKNSIWTVALVYGFFRQVKLQMSGKDFNLTLIARRSRHYAGTRYLKRGVNEKGRVANDVETEQIVSEDVPDGCTRISSVVQNRGSIPLFWSQDSSNLKPDIILSKKDPKYEATRLHFENLAKRYGNPIIILNLIKTREKRPRESILRAEFHNAIDLINKDLSDENRLKFLHWDLNKFSKSKATDVLALLAKIAAYAINLTGFFYCEFQPSSRTGNMLNCSSLENSDDHIIQRSRNSTNTVCTSSDGVGGSNFSKLLLQKGVLRTNCIDCLDRTNVAQYAYGLVAFGCQLQALGLQDTPNIDLGSPLADDLMRAYEMMGDTLALQYCGSAAHNKIFCERRGQWKAATQSQEIFRTLQRFYSNVYVDAEKQDAINVFLGHFQPHQGKPELWELDSDQHHNVGNRISNYSEESARSAFKRSLSDGNMLRESNSPIEISNVDKHETIKQTFPDKVGSINKIHSESTPEILHCESQASYTSFLDQFMSIGEDQQKKLDNMFDSFSSSYMFNPGMSGRQLFPDVHPEPFPESDKISLGEPWNSFNYSNFLDSDWHSSSGNSCEEELYERSVLINSSDAGRSSCSVVSELKAGASTSASGSEMQGTSTSNLSDDAPHSSNFLAGFSDTFVNWVERCCSLDNRQ